MPTLISSRLSRRRFALSLAALPLLAGAAAVGALVGAAVPARAESFLTAIADLPLAPGLDELAGQGLVYDKPGGRIVEAYAAGQTSAPAVRAFYAETLPQLGWEALGETAWRREGERLDLAVLSETGTILVRFTLRPE